MSGFRGTLDIRALEMALSATVQEYKLLAPLIYDSAAFGTITVPEGLVTDFASIPAAALWYIDDDSPQILRPSVIHDAVYSTKGVVAGRAHPLTRAEADELLHEAMLVCGADSTRARVVHAAVRIFGASRWK